jgi:hypothetical protein
VPKVEDWCAALMQLSWPWTEHAMVIMNLWSRD